MAVVYDAIVVGAGIQGSSTAYNLVNRNKKTLLIEQFPLLHGRGSSHGHSRLLRTAYFAEHWYYSGMTMQSKLMWRHLEEEAGMEIYKEIGCLSIALDPKQAGPSEESMTKFKIPYRKLSTSELRSQYPMIHVHENSVALVEDGAGMLLADKALQAYQKLFINLGGYVRDCEQVVDIIPGDVISVKTSKSEYKTRSIVITPGPWASKLLKPLGLSLPLQPWKVTVMYWREKHPGMFRSDHFPALRFINAIRHNGMLHRLYGCPSHEYPGMFKLCLHEGVPCDPEERDKNSTDWDIQLVSDFISKHIPDLETSPAIVETCFYTMTPDSDYILDYHPKWQNIVIGAGFSGHGFKTAPLTGTILADLATNKKPSIENMSPFSINRFTQNKLKSKI